MFTITRPADADSPYLIGRGRGAQLQNPMSVFSVLMDAEPVADELWLIELSHRGEHVYAEVLKASNNALTIEEFVDCHIYEWSFVKIVRKLWEADF